MRILSLPSGTAIPVLGQGTWGVGEDRAKRKSEIAALHLGLDLGMTLIDTAEMYGDGDAEELIGEAIAGRRTEVFLVSKVYPHNGHPVSRDRGLRAQLEAAQDRSLDLYLLHWRGSVPLAETLPAFQSTRRQRPGRDRHRRGSGGDRQRGLSRNG